MIDFQQLKENLKSLQNHIEVSFILINLNRQELLPSILEDIYCLAQEITDDYCIER